MAPADAVAWKKSNVCSFVPELEEQVMEWINLCEEWKVPIVTVATIRFKCNEIRQKMQLENPLKNTKLDTLRFSNGWLSRFQARHGIKSRRTHGEEASVFDENVMNGSRVLPWTTPNVTSLTWTQLPTLIVPHQQNQFRN
ncbi:hypothetical protein Ae201684P_019113 [Aphanomyces euteiches]|uniref:HTH CENPB-type domain-containing protein n=1 Tax=Aphanomyces euteiches TaxID=100861 RepID=A0A6G0XES4_9STRA|nr:hypothetical protein Ae201684_005634 [Aphanomyces euteiches]KAH9078007.1 hypothetical protein Ae201684P_019113 [Aphanomyces euteiches]